MATKLTYSEARAEACTIVLQIILSGMPKKRLRKLRKRALQEAKTIGHRRVSAELDWLFIHCNLG